jgi:hypothetical protein
MNENDLEDVFNDAERRRPELGSVLGDVHGRIEQRRRRRQRWTVAVAGTAVLAVVGAAVVLSQGVPGGARTAAPASSSTTSTSAPSTMTSATFPGHPADTSGANCMAFSVSSPQNGGGATTALEALLHSDAVPDGWPRPSANWTPTASSDKVVYTGASATITVSRYADGTWGVESGEYCDGSVAAGQDPSTLQQGPEPSSGAPEGTVTAACRGWSAGLASMPPRAEPYGEATPLLAAQQSSEGPTPDGTWIAAEGNGSVTYSKGDDSITVTQLPDKSWLATSGSTCG